MLLASACVPDPNGGISWYWSRTTVLVTGVHAKVTSSVMQLGNLRRSCEEGSTEKRGKDEQMTLINLEIRGTERMMLRSMQGYFVMRLKCVWDGCVCAMN